MKFFSKSKGVFVAITAIMALAGFSACARASERVDNPPKEQCLHENTQQFSNDEGHGDVCLDCEEQLGWEYHTLVTDEAVEATCTQTGFTAGEHCEECGYVTVKQEEIEKLPHGTYGYSWEYDAEEHWIECSCGEIYEQEEHTIPDGICKECSYFKHTPLSAFSYRSDGNSISIVRGYNTNYRWLIVPDEIDGLPVTKIEDYAFAFLDYESVVLGKYVTSIGDFAFYNFSGKVVVPNNVTEIQENTFSYCWQYTTVYENGYYYGNEENPCLVLMGVSESVTTFEIPAQTRFIVSEAFEDCESLESITIPDSVAWIGEYAFYRCKNLTSVTMGNNVTHIGEYAFSNCGKLENITLSEGLTSLGYSAFSGCDSLKEIAIPEGITKIEAHTFGGDSLTKVTLPKGLTRIEQYAFSECENLQQIILPDGLQFVGDYAFEGCDKLECTSFDNAYYLPSESNDYFMLLKTKSREITSCTISEQTKIIYGKAFEYCDDLLNITIPDGVISVNGRAFNGCDGVQTLRIGKGVSIVNLASLTAPSWIEVDAENAYYKSIDGNLYSKDGKTLLRYASQKTATYFTVPDGVTEIAENAFLRSKSLTRIKLPYGLKKIGDGAFQSCTSLTEIEVPDGVESIGAYAFMYCKNLKSIFIPDSVLSVGISAFVDCDSLKYNEYNNAYYLGNSSAPCVVLVKAINQEITICNIPNYTTVICYNAFENCVALTTVTLGYSVREIGWRAFHGCGALTRIIFPNSVEKIDDNAFGGCTSLESVTFGKYLEEIGYAAFFGCITLKSVVIPSSVSHIGEYSFSNCNSLGSVTFEWTEGWVKWSGEPINEEYLSDSSRVIGLLSDYVELYRRV